MTATKKFATLHSCSTTLVQTMQAIKFGLYVCLGVVVIGAVDRVEADRRAKFVEQQVQERERIARAYSTKQIKCLAMNAYYEARSDHRRSMIAVTQVVMNRANILNTDPCDVVYERNRRGCQFSWTCNPQRAKHWEDESYRRALNVAYDVYNGKVSDIVAGATHYHTTAIRPFWSRSNKFIKVDKIGSHVYYKSMENRWRMS